MAAIQMHATRLFGENGYNATTVEQIAEAAEVSPSTFFRYFPTKEDVVIKDNYDPLLVAAFEEQPAELSPLQAIRAAMKSAFASFTAEDIATLRERNRLIMTVPELRAASMNNMIQTMHLIAELVAKRTKRRIDDIAVQTFAGAFIGVSISIMFYDAEHPEGDIVQLLDEAWVNLEAGLPL
ncbi:TetR family transcriptional regulator [Cohnella faecalis]|uniref:TetR family transcriptional regulator n=2 Tax=Cohnella faecalis TaxID=2315694 RepID=A0A398CIK6_9BACL|nr:TetR family transcriptional regulator [Cohnella faecalis]